MKNSTNPRPKINEESEMKQSIIEDTTRLADAIEKLEAAVEALNGSRLKRKAILVLLAHDTKLSQKTIDEVLNSLVNIRRTYLK